MPFSNGDNTNTEYYYKSCSSSFSCGSVKNLGYPFWRGDMPEQCGQQGFKLSCSQNHTDDPHISIGNNYIKVRSVNRSSHTMVLYQDKNKTCSTLGTDQMLTVAPPFQFCASVVNISLFYGCTNSSISHHRHNSFWCSSFGNNVSVYYFDKPRPDFGNASKPCNTTITARVLKTAVDGLEKGTGTLEGVLEKGLEVEYTVDFKACSACQNSSGICGSSGHPSWKFMCYHPVKEKRYLGLILGLGISGGTSIIALVALWYWRKLKSKFVSRRSSLEPTKSDLEKGSIYFGVPLFSYRELEEATHNFDQSKELGDGGFGRVYHGKLRDGREVAVKRLYERSFKTVEQFMNEVQILTRLRHNNLVSLYGCTSPRCTHLLLVYEYVSNGTVADHLYGHVSTSGQLSWPVRMKIAIETANALSYLHASDIIHRDVKTNNILLDSSFGVKVADFGLSRLFPDNVTHVSTAPQGTPGYLDPEYHQCYQLTVKSDVYSFGVVLIELVSSLPAVDMNRHKNEINLSNYAMNMIQRCAFDELVDPQLGFGHDFKVRKMTISVAELAFRCLQHDKDFRPSIDEVLENLMRIESADYEALEVVESSMPPPALTEDDDAGLLSSHEMDHLSPNCVMDSWNSMSTTTSSTGKQGANFSSMQANYMGSN